MLELKNIVKEYAAGDSRVTALKGVNIQFRESEFVSILGPSGCGKTTLLNIIGGLDQYTDGDLFINGKSTKDFRDADWDTYRNHAIGFVFQSYNLIPHQSVLANVELALTLSGVSKSERRRRAVEALGKVGLADQIHKRPNQMSGGQMQRVAIARALINDPDILLADEPTGALDSETSVQIMDLLKEIAKNKLVIMVTHNPDLAKEYSTRIIRLLDGRVTDDSDPYTAEAANQPQKAEKKAAKKRSMSFLTALSLSLNNLMTKKTRTLLTSFAGSIGIIGIALVLSLSNGIQAFIDQVQEDTLASYPIAIQDEEVDLTSLMTSLMGARRSSSEHPLDAVYVNPIAGEIIDTVTNPEVKQNNLKDFKVFLEDENNGISDLISALDYSYDFDFNVYVKDTDGKIVKSNANELMRTVMGVPEQQNEADSSSRFFSNEYSIYEQMIAGRNGEMINDLLKSQYDVIYGSWPTAYDEVVLVVSEDNEISDLALLALGLKTTDEMKALTEPSDEKESEDDAALESWSYEDICGTTFRLVPSYSYYSYDKESGRYIDISGTDAGLTYLYDTGIDMKVVGIIRQNPDATSAMLRGTVAYTKALSDHIAEVTENSEVVKAQKADPDTDVILGLPFKTENDTEPEKEEKAEAFKQYAASLTTLKKAELYKEVAADPFDDYVTDTVERQMKSVTREYVESMMVDSYAAETGMDPDTLREYVTSVSDEELFDYVRQMMSETVRTQYGEQVLAGLVSYSPEQLAAMLDGTLAGYTTDQLAEIYDRHMPPTKSESTFEENLRLLGVIDQSRPSAINIYASSFEAKDTIAGAITTYNEGVAEEDQISYTDYIGLIMSSVTVIINAFSYVLIAFVSISLVVSSIMIGIITYISVLERTKEIGILRAIGASKKDVSRIFNAETLIIGFAAGLFGILFTLLLCLPLNAVIHALSGIANLRAALPVAGGVILVLISMLLTFIAGLIPSGIAAKKDPVEALRSE